MDVRCERCSTEYELEDDSVSAEGTDVQCTSCGHTFRVHRPTGGTEVGAGAAASPPPADWLLETTSGDGQVHRFRDLTALQKWIIERKVTREDRISKTGQAWRRLGEIVELQPFFDVVDEADRAKAAAAAVAARGLSAQAADARRSGRTPAAGLSVDGPDAPGGPGRSTPPAARGAQRSSEIMPVEAPGDEAGIDTAVVRIGGGRWKVVVGLAIAGAIAYFGIQRLNGGLSITPAQLAALGRRAISEPARAPEVTPLTGSGSATAGSATAGSATAAPPAAESPPAPPPGEPPAVAAAPATPPPPPAAAPPAAPPAVETPASVPDKPVAAPATERVRPAGARARAAAAAAAAVAAGGEAPPDLSYEQLVIGGDKALENGASGRALRLFERALKLQPDGAEALAGLGYVNLDRQRVEAAVSYFRRSLAVSPYAPAMFGMGEAYRALGDKARALDAYQRYLAVSPGGADAPAARRQMKALGEVEGPPPTPATILQEGATE
jgi:predicted Zn finger-like uncharacterized protein